MISVHGVSSVTAGTASTLAPSSIGGSYVRVERPEAIIDRIIDACSVEPDTTGHDDRLKVHKAQAEAILKPAEAYAWLHNPNNPHG